MNVKALLVVLFCMSTAIKANHDKADMIIFSFDRPLQLYALLESVKTNVSGVDTVTVVYRTSSDEFDYAYKLIHDSFKEARFVKQGTQPREDFKPLTLAAINNSPNKYVIFAVDDNIVKDHVDLDYCIHAMKKHHAYGVYLRLGFNTDFCYTMNQAQSIPVHYPLESGLYAWQFCNGTCDWGYPNTVDLTLFKKSDIINTLESLSFYSPNVLENAWAATSASVATRIGLFFAQSKIVNLPLNIVQQDWHNRNQQELLPEDQLALFFENKKIDLTPLHQIENKSPHMEYCPTFVDRT
ncbi:hypothetical protein Noda2021_07430 [Candidatus Dependentiae bacterium Noda2021]|nr:hypothetical protein Noda2021_07430 [Candidatus Dependentiae bacterium Noda2021]